jgi:endogenous inhibitor of DNA gyrase (YacG/DUF329 family)
MAQNPEIVEVPCPDCGELSPEPIERVVGNDVIPCSLCGGLIDLSDESCVAIVNSAKQRFKKN